MYRPSPSLYKWMVCGWFVDGVFPSSRTVQGVAHSACEAAVEKLSRIRPRDRLPPVAVDFVISSAFLASRKDKK